jgi:hypothetical protein
MPEEGRGVSVEMKQRKYIKTMMLTDERSGESLFEANFGQLIELTLTDDSVLEMGSNNGTLRVDVTFEEIAAIVDRIRSGNASGSMLGSASNPSKSIEMKK